MPLVAAVLTSPVLYTGRASESTVSFLALGGGVEWGPAMEVVQFLLMLCRLVPIMLEWADRPRRLRPGDGRITRVSDPDHWKCPSAVEVSRVVGGKAAAGKRRADSELDVFAWRAEHAGLSRSRRCRRRAHCGIESLTAESRESARVHSGFAQE